MIKCEVTVCGSISRSAIVKQTKDGQGFVSFGVTIPIPIKDNKGSSTNLDISVTMDGDADTAAKYTTGRRVMILGTLTLRQRGDITYYNLKAEGGVELAKMSDPDSIEGTMSFIGKIGNHGVENKTDSKGNPFMAFSAWSSDRDASNISFIWVRFLYFHSKGETFIAAGNYVHVEGSLQIGAYISKVDSKPKISLDCIVRQISPRERKD